MKNQIKLFFWALALAFYSAPAVGQGSSDLFENPLIDTLKIYSSIDTTKLNRLQFFNLRIRGNEEHDFSKLLRLKSVQVEIFSSVTGLTKHESALDNFEIAYETPFDTTSWYGDFDENNYQRISMNQLLSREFDDLKIYGPLNIENLVPGEILTIKVILGIGLDGVTPTYYYPKNQYIFYGKPDLLSTTNQPTKPKVNIYPNPFVNEINVDLPQEVNISITNSLGQTIYQGKSGKINVDFVNGVYFVHTPYGNFPVVKH